MSKPVTRVRSRITLKIASILLAILTGLLLVVLYFPAESLVERYLKKQVAKQTEGLYKLDINELQLNLFTWSMTLHGLHLYPDTAVHRRQKETGRAGRSLIEVQSPELRLTGINLIDILFNNRLSVGAVVAERPAITHLLDESVDKNIGGKSKSGSKSAGSMEAVHIRKIDIQEGSYRYRVLGEQNRPQHEIPHLSLQVQDLKLDLQEQQDIYQMLSAGAVELGIRNYAYHSPDSVYAIRVGRFTYSSGRQELKAENVEVLPDHQANTALSKEEAHRTVYQLSAPLLHITGLDVATAWHTKRLQLDRILLEDIDLQLLEDLTVPDTTAPPKLAEIYARLSPYLKELSAEELRLTSGGFSYSQKTPVVFVVHHLDKADITVQALQLDSVTLFKPKEKVFAEEIQVITKNYIYSPLYSPYTLTAEHMELSTRNKTLRVDTILLASDWSKNDSLKNLNKAKRTFYNIELPHLRFHDMDLLEAFQTSRLAIGNIAAVQPVIDMRTDQLVSKKEEDPDLQEMYRNISGLVTALSIGEISITDASFTHHIKNRKMQRLQQLDNASLKAIGLKVDSAFVFDPEEKLPLQDIVVTARSYRYQMPDNTYTFALSGLHYSTRQQEFSARSVDVISSIRANDRQKHFDNASRSLFDLSATTFRVTGVNVIKALNTGRLEADLLELRQPDVAILLDRTVATSAMGKEGAGKKFFGVFDVVSVHNIRLEDGSFTFNEKLQPVMRAHHMEHVTASATAFELTPAGFKNLNEELPMQEMILLAKNYTYRSTDSLYIIKLDSLHYSSRQQELIARTFTVSADRKVNERLKAEKPEMASRNLIDISAKRSRITGFNLIHAYATGHYNIESMLLAAPEVSILQDHNVPANNSKPADGQDTTATNGAMQQLASMVTSFRVGHVQVTDGTFDFHILEDTIRTSQTLAHVALEMEQVRLVSLEANDPLDIFDVDDIRVLVQGYTFYTRDSLYVLEVKEIRLNEHEKSLSADSLRLRPLYSKEEYADRFTYAHDRVDLVVPDIEMMGISMRALFNNQDLVAQKMVIRNPNVEIYRDNSIGLDPERRPPTLQEMLRKAELYIRLDTILVDKKNLIHPVIAIDAFKPAVFLLEDIRMELYNVTNDSVLIRNNNIITVNASALLMGASRLKVNFQFQMDHPEDRYTYEGTLEPMDLTAFNPLFENMLFIRVKSGLMQKASFSVESTEHMATGQVRFPYTNLKIELLDKQNPENPSFLLKATSLLVNSLVIKSNNPSVWGKFRKGGVKEERDPQKAVFHHMGQAMFNGVTSSIMLNLVERIVAKFVDL